jgi:hypothetical protein
VTATRSSRSSASQSSTPRREGPLWIVIFVLMGLCLCVAASLVTNQNYDDEEATTATMPEP